MILINNTVEDLDKCRGRHLLMVWYDKNSGGVVIENLSWVPEHRPLWKHPAQSEALTTEELVKLCGGVKQWRQIYPMQLEAWEPEVEKLQSEIKDLRDQLKVLLNHHERHEAELQNNDLNMRTLRSNVRQLNQQVQEQARQYAMIQSTNSIRQVPTTFLTSASANTHWPDMTLPPEITDKLLANAPIWQEVSNEESPSHQDRGSGAAQDSSVADTDSGDTGVLDSAG